MSKITIFEDEIRTTMKENDIPADKYEEFKKYLTIDIPDWLDENARSYARDKL